MKAIISVTGVDHVGIVAAVATGLADLDVNILNISQTIMSDYFTMILQCDLNDKSVTDVQQHMDHVAGSQGLKVRVQSAAIFDAMHKI
ncbi:MAG: ACT domain-containing protein [Actinomycetaceae bacterium]|nr:ACT domain-containing protein [Actinomycetaceae bacterium]